MTLEEMVRKSMGAMVKWESKDFAFLHSIYNQVMEGNGLTTKQAFVVGKIIRKHKKALADAYYIDVPTLTHHLENPTYETPPRVSITRRPEVRYLGDNLLAFSCDTTEQSRAFLQRVKGSHADGLMVVAVCSITFDHIIEFIATGFEMDEETEAYLALCMTSKGKTSQFVACDDLIVCNVVDNEVLSNFIIHVLDGEVV